MIGNAVRNGAEPKTLPATVKKEDNYRGMRLMW